MAKTVSVSHRDIRRYEVIQQLIRKDVNGTEAAELLHLSVRQVKRLKAAVRRRGIAALQHGNTGKQSNRRLPERKRQKIARLIRDRYADFGPTFASEKLRGMHGIDHHSTTIRELMIAEGLWKPRQKKKEEHRQWRQCRSHIGELIQFDGSYEYWFENRGKKCCLLLGVDDATTGIPHGRFASDEGVFPVFAFWREYVERYGKPMGIYLDRFSTYKMTQQAAIDNHDLKTQFQRAMEELRIEVIFAYSPQAKGRVENKFKTLQDRLIKELRLAGISDLEHANDFLEKTFFPAFNQQFAREPRSAENLHRPLTQKERQQLPSIFSKQTQRTIQNDWTISFNNQWYQLTKRQPVTVRKRDTVVIEERLDGTIKFRLRGKYLNAAPIPKRPPKGRKQPWIIPATYR